MSKGPFADLIDGMIRIGEFNLQIYSSMANAFGATLAKPPHVAVKSVDPVGSASVSCEEVDVAAAAIERELLGKYELGFQLMLRTNYPRERIREIAKIALQAARGARDQVNQLD